MPLGLNTNSGQLATGQQNSSLTSRNDLQKKNLAKFVLPALFLSTMFWTVFLLKIPNVGNEIRIIILAGYVLAIIVTILAK